MTWVQIKHKELQALQGPKLGGIPLNTEDMGILLPGNLAISELYKDVDAKGVPEPSVPLSLKVRAVFSHKPDHDTRFFYPYSK